MDVSGKTVLVTGAGRGIGRVLATHFARKGANLALLDMSRTELDETAAQCAQQKVIARSYVASVQDEAEVVSTMDRIVTDFGRLDVLINMASVYASVPFDAMDENTWHSVVDIDLRATFLCSHAAVKHMRLVGGGRIVNFSDWLAHSGRPRYPGYLPYYVAKKGVIGLTEALALEVAADQILVNAIAPGPILAPPGTSDKELEDVANATPLGRWGGEESIVHAVVFLLETEFVTGETIRVDGGRHVK